MPAVRERVEQALSAPLRAAATTASAAPAYILYALGTGQFSFRSLTLILLLAAIASFWYVVLPKRPSFDLLFLVFLGSVYLLKCFQILYPNPLPRTYANVLGTLMWVRIGMMAVLSLRQMGGIGFGFIPRREDWWTGFRFYLYFLPFGIGLALALNFLRPDPIPLSVKTIGVAIATFLGTLWVLAAMEEVFFRGLLQQILARELGGAVKGLIVASVLFGLVHLPYRSFPNWRFALLATIAGLFYGAAYRRARSVRASMVTHALVVTTWRVFLG